MKKRSLRKTRWLIVGITVLVAVLLWWFFPSVGDKLAIVAMIVGSMAEWQLIRCPRCGRHLGWWDKEICATCAAAIAESEEREKRGKQY